MSYSKDRNKVPGFVSDKDKPFVRLISTEDAQDEAYRQLGYKTPGWAMRRQITKSDGSFRNIVETLVSFSGAGTKIGPVTAAPAPAITTQPSISGNATTGSVLTLNRGAATGTPTPTATYQWLRGTTALPGEDALTLDTGGHGAGVGVEDWQ